MPGPNDYNPADWYWSVPGKGVWASARAAYVAEDDSGFRRFLAEGGFAHSIGETELAEVLDAHGLPGPVEYRREKTREQAAIEALIEKGALTEAEIEEKRVFAPAVRAEPDPAGSPTRR